jgi:hypothetical protein
MKRAAMQARKVKKKTKQNKKKQKKTTPSRTFELETLDAARRCESPNDQRHTVACEPRVLERDAAEGSAGLCDRRDNIVNCVVVNFVRRHKIFHVPSLQ